MTFFKKRILRSSNTENDSTRGIGRSWKAYGRMDSFSRTKKNMHRPIREGIQEALKDLKALCDDPEDTDCYFHSFKYLIIGGIRKTRRKDLLVEMTLPSAA